MQATTGRCRVAGCGALVSGHMLLCQPHWRLVPGDLRRALDSVRRTAPTSCDEALAVAARYVEAYQLIRRHGQGGNSPRQAHKILRACTAGLMSVESFQALCKKLSARENLVLPELLCENLTANLTAPTVLS